MTDPPAVASAIVGLRELAGSFIGIASQLGDAQIEWCRRVDYLTCVTGLKAAVDASIAADQMAAKQHWGTRRNQTDVGKYNAFHHMLWMAMMTAQGIDVRTALELGIAHEMDNKTRNHEWNTHNSQVERYNNRVGADLGTNFDLVYVGTESRTLIQELVLANLSYADLTGY